MKKVPVYYTTIKQPQDQPNIRVYHISRWIGRPFLKFPLPSDFEGEKFQVATHLGLLVSQIEWQSHRGH